MHVASDVTGPIVNTATAESRSEDPQPKNNTASTPPGAGNPHDNPAHDNPAHDNPAHDNPAHDNPAHDYPAHDYPAHNRPAHDDHHGPAHDHNDQAGCTASEDRDRLWVVGTGWPQQGRSSLWLAWHC